ncbi:MAG: hypothetical protein R2838_04090 [Caldilineaceae bacterium]
MPWDSTARTANLLGPLALMQNSWAARSARLAALRRVDSARAGAHRPRRPGPDGSYCAARADAVATDGMSTLDVTVDVNAT